MNYTNTLYALACALTLSFSLAQAMDFEAICKKMIQPRLNSLDAAVDFWAAQDIPGYEPRENATPELAEIIILSPDKELVPELSVEEVCAQLGTRMPQKLVLSHPSNSEQKELPLYPADTWTSVQHRIHLLHGIPLENQSINFPDPNYLHPQDPLESCLSAYFRSKPLFLIDKSVEKKAKARTRKLNRQTRNRVR